MTKPMQRWLVLEKTGVEKQKAKSDDLLLNILPSQVAQESKEKVVKEQFGCVHRGRIEAKNKGKVDMYFVE